jgi:hypothetical protein
MDMKVTNLSEKAMLVKLTMRRANLTRRDSVAELVIQQQMDDSSLTVLSKLFRDKNNPINQIMTAMSEVYTYHKNHTLPYIDKGPRILPNNLYMEYTQDMRGRISSVDNLLAKFIPNYDQYVQLDIAYRSKGSGRARVEDYPTADEFQARMGFDLRFMPLPDQKHFLFDLSDSDVDNFMQAMRDAEVAARTDAIGRMLEPLKHLVDKLNRPIGTEGAIFRDSAVENVAEGLEIARKLMMDTSPELEGVIKELDAAVSKYANNKEWLRESPIVREQAAKKLDDIAKQMGAFMGA